ncbi:class I SAM-dependent methyltransferase [Psychroflexus tropicus]|uniref:class I SAM-dependent methyltransferase n=1 Tax=Psychroflexus tropicus TaxID=197345 RepID=UPI001FDF51A4|nr:class I SAM-dependent methyltransferase [Psychroflexus tropicus]
MSFEEQQNCPLCNNAADYFCFISNVNRTYFRCKVCNAVFLSNKNYVDLQTEKARYLKHNNDVEDSRYQKFVEPITNAVQLQFPKFASGLDYGCGTGPVASAVLKNNGYKQIALYDPIFHPDLHLLEVKYDFIICCEVMEHFFYPRKEFSLLKSLLKDSGKLYCKTSLLQDGISEEEFKDWWYKDDPTHVFFCSPKTLRFIADHFNFKDLVISPKLIIFN